MRTKKTCLPLYPTTKLRRGIAGAFLCTTLLAGVAGNASAAIVAFSGAGATAADISALRDSFRLAVGGGTTPAANGDFGGVRREINWDGVPTAFSDPTLLPANFFNSNSPRGVVFSTPGSGFLVSAGAGTAAGTPILFGFPADLKTFSPEKLFATVGSTTLDIDFFVPGTSTAATTSAFAAIFVDVETNNSVDATTMEFFDAAGNQLFRQTALAAGNQGLSFLGGVANAGERIGRVRITTPNNFLLSNGQRANETTDFVVMDDFLYATPSAISLPSALSLTLLGALAMLAAGRRARKDPPLAG